MNQKKYKFMKGLKKGLLAAAAIGVGMAAGAEALGSLEAVQEISVIGVVGVAVTVVRTGLNWWKINRDLADKRYIH